MKKMARLLPILILTAIVSIGVRVTALLDSLHNI